MTLCIAYFDLLDDGLVQEVIRHFSQTAGFQWWRYLSCCSRRLCTLVRRTRHVRIRSHAEGVLHLVRAPPHRAFTHVRSLHLDQSWWDRRVQAWALFQDATLAAVAAWPQLGEVSLSGGLSAGDGNCEPGCLSGPLLALRHATALRRLKLELSEQHSLVYVEPLTQLTHLELYSINGLCLSVPSNGHRCPLVNMPNLVSLELTMLQLYHEEPGTLPPHLTRLTLKGCYSGWSGWGPPVGSCQQLRELSIETMGDVESHPTVLLLGVADQLTGLVNLTLWRSSEAWKWGPGTLNEAIAAVQQQLGEDEDDSSLQPSAPLTIAHGYPHPEACIMVPPPNMGALCNLQKLHTWNWWLVVSSERYWRALAGCSSLRSLEDLHASVPPPAGVAFPHLTSLKVTTSTSPGDTVTLLGAFPALRELQLTVAASSQALTAAPQQPSPSSATRLAHLATAAITLLEPLGLAAADSAQCLAGYCSSLSNAMPGLKSLELAWPSGVQLLSQLSGVLELQQLSSIHLWSHMIDSRSHFCCHQPQLVDAQQVVQVLRPLQQLTRVQLGLDMGPGSSRLVLGLQEALPGLTQLQLWCGQEGLGPGTLAALQPSLSVQRSY